MSQLLEPATRTALDGVEWRSPGRLVTRLVAEAEVRSGALGTLSYQNYRCLSPADRLKVDRDSHALWSEDQDSRVFVFAVVLEGSQRGVLSVLGRSSSADEIEDCVSDAVVKTLGRSGSWSGERPLGGYAFVVGKHVAKDLVRSRCKQPARLSGEVEATSAPDSSDAAQELELVRRALNEAVADDAARVVLRSLLEKHQLLVAESDPRPPSAGQRRTGLAVIRRALKRNGVGPEEFAEALRRWKSADWEVLLRAVEDERELVTVAEASRLTSVPERTIRRGIARGLLPSKLKRRCGRTVHLVELCELRARFIGAFRRHVRAGGNRERALHVRPS